MKKLAPVDILIVEAVENNLINSEDILWDFEGSGNEFNNLKFMSDPQLRNTVLKIMGFGETEYDASDEDKALWIRILRVEWKNRRNRASFAKSN